MAKRSGLGKGLQALIVESGSEAQIKGLSEVSLKKIVVNPNQPRKAFNKEKMRELVESIQTHGVLQPVLLREQGNQYQILAGERRVTAAKQAGLSTIPAYIKEVKDKDVLPVALVENVQREDLNPIEEANAYHELITNYGFTQTSLAKVLSKSRPVIANALRLLELPKHVVSLLEQGEISEGHARLLLTIKNKEKQEKIANEVVKEHLSVRETKKLIEKRSKNQAEKAYKEPKQNHEKAAALLEKELGRKVKITTTQEKGNIQICFEGKKDFEDLVKLLLKGKAYEQVL